MSEQPNLLLLLILFTALVVISILNRSYKEQIEKLLKENFEMAKKLGKAIGICEYCGKEMEKNHPSQRFHRDCFAESHYPNRNKKRTGGIAILHNGVEVMLNVFGKEISNSKEKMLGLKSEGRNI